MANLYEIDWSHIPKPEDDGAASHLTHALVERTTLRATDGSLVDIAALHGMTVLYVYPITGRPDTSLPDNWDGIPGARGCTPQSCAFRDHFTDLKACGVDHLYGLSTQTSEYQVEAVDRMHLPFQLLSDADHEFGTAMNLPTFKVNGMTLLKRITMIIRDGAVIRTFYPVFPPDQNVNDVMEWLRLNDGHGE